MPTVSTLYYYTTTKSRSSLLFSRRLQATLFPFVSLLLLELD